MIFGLFRGKGNGRLIARLHAEVVAAAREPLLFTDYGIADDLDGRFESMALHAVLVLRRLKQWPPPGPDMAQDLADVIFRHFDRGLRELGIGDISVPRRMRDLAEAFLGRANTYDAALNQPGDVRLAALAAALSRNVYAGRQDGKQLAAYVMRLDATLQQMPLAEFLEGPIFGENAANAREVLR